jgi:hypothetical protein
VAKFRQRSAEIDGCGRFPDATLLVRKRNNSHDNQDRQMMLPGGSNGN